MHTTFRLSVFLLFMVQLFCSCTSDSLPEPDSTQPETPAGIPDAYQDKIRTQPYPKADNELYLNPAPLIVPQAMKTGERLQFSLSLRSPLACAVRVTFPAAVVLRISARLIPHSTGRFVSRI